MCQASAKLVPGPQNLGRNARAHRGCLESKHTSAFGAEVYGVGLPIGDGFRGSRTHLGLFIIIACAALCSHNLWCSVELTCSLAVAAMWWWLWLAIYLQF
jgi:hypothetical protein